MTSANLPFIVSTNQREPDVETRKFIRRHVMRGKNRGPKPRRKNLQTLPVGMLQPETLIPIGPYHRSSITTILSSRFAGIRFAAQVEPYLVSDVLMFISVLPKAMYLLNDCMVDDSIETPSAWIAPMLFDAAFLHAVCFTTQAYFDHLRAGPRSVQARRRDDEYYAKAVRALQEHLNDTVVRLSDSTIMTVLLLSGHAYTIGCYESANIHIKGLLDLVRMRGLSSLLQHPKVVIEIIRSDLSLAVDQCCDPFLFESDTVPWSLAPMSSTAPVPAAGTAFRSDGSSFLNTLDPDLAPIWTTMQDFCALVNAAAEERVPSITEATFIHYMGAVMYRLHQPFGVGTLDEAVRMALLAFASPVFLNWNRMELPDPRFTANLQQALVALMQSKHDAASQELVWLLTVGAMTVSHEPESFELLQDPLKIYIQTCGLLTWGSMRELLSTFIWIGSVFDRPGQAVFASLLSR